MSALSEMYKTSPGAHSDNFGSLNSLRNETEFSKSLCEKLFVEKLNEGNIQKKCLFANNQLETSH